MSWRVESFIKTLTLAFTKNRQPLSLQWFACLFPICQISLQMLVAVDFTW